MRMDMNPRPTTVSNSTEKFTLRIVNLQLRTDRKGTMIHPDFQKRGFGTALTYHCNAISDRTGGKTYVPARPSSNHMFRQCGFREVGTHNADLKRFGRNPEKDITYMLVRDAPN